MSKKIKDYISLYPNAFSKQECQNLIDKFEKYTDYHDKRKIEAKDGWHMEFTQLHLVNHQEFDKEYALLKERFIRGISIYKKEHNIQSHQWPKQFQLEPFRMKRYLPNTQESFGEHVEVTNLETAKRFMVALIYLNDDFEGGETDFVQLDFKVKPQQGSMAIFPATWNWLHKAHPVRGERGKYFVGTLLHYV